MKIGVYDSGLGGVSVLKELVKEIPASYYYLSDSKNNPYGDKSKKELKKIIFNNIEYLIEKNCKIIVIACNTATSVAIDDLRKKFKDIIFIGTEPAIKVVYDELPSKSTLLIGTKITLKSKRIKSLLKKYPIDNLKVIPCVGLADIIEKGELDKVIPYFDKYLKDYKTVDTIILGCTHYSLIKKHFTSYFKNAKLIDGNNGIVKYTKEKAKNIKSKNKKIIFDDTGNDKNKKDLFDYYFKNTL